MNAKAYIIAARRTPVAPRGGALATCAVHDLAAPVLRACLDDAGFDAAQLDDVILGNALYGGGNPARVAALAANIPEHVPALSIDRQCCSGLDAVLMAARMVESQSARAVLAGGVESYSRSPIRAHRPRDTSDQPQPYERPAFTPWPSRDPDMIEAGAAIAARFGYTRSDQAAWAIDSHAKARAAQSGVRGDDLVMPDGVTIDHDAFTRELSPALCARARVLAGDEIYGVDNATTAVEADAAAALLVCSQDMVGDSAPHLRVIDGVTVGSDPELPGLAPIAAIKTLLTRTGHKPGDIAVAEIMEAFAAQAMACAYETGLNPARVNPGGGALARGHPIGASGAILMVQLWAQLRAREPGTLGLAAIASAGGLGTAVLIQRV